MASDLPEAGHSSSLAMAKVLVTYMDCPEAIHRAIKLDFDRPPAVHTIRDLRADYLRQRDRVRQPAFKPHDGYHPDQASRAAEEASRRFLAALRREAA